jgi:hypothetical protein
MSNKNKVIQMTLEEFTERYSTPYLTGKYGEEWVGVVLDEQFKKGKHIQIVEKATPVPSPSYKPNKQFNSLDLT